MPSAGGDALIHIAAVASPMADFYGTRAWRRLAAECIRLNPVCSTRGCGQPSRFADHIIARVGGVADTRANLRATVVAAGWSP